MPKSASFPPLLYNAGIVAYTWAIRIAAAFHPGAARWVNGRRGVFELIERECQQLDGPIVWMHCASAGEFEQGKPILDAIRQAWPDLKLVVTFWSPSGYEVRKDDPSIDAVWYLPGDSRGDARRFMDILRPAAGIFVKYDFWLNTIAAADAAEVPLYLVSARFRPEQIFFRSPLNPAVSWFRAGLSRFQALFCQDRRSLELLAGIGLTGVLAPDTRFDRVASIREALEKGTDPLPGNRQNQLELLKSTRAGRKAVVAGSTWPQDEELLTEWAAEELPDDWFLLLVPHQTEAAHIDKLGRLLDGSGLRWQRLSQMKVPGEKLQIAVVDTQGLLSRLYGLADLAYVGGGFGVAVHNTLEPAAFGIPVVFGPQNRKFLEIQSLKSCGAGFEIRDGNSLHHTLGRLISNDQYRAEAGAASRSFVDQNRGGTKTILASLQSALRR